MGSLNDEVVYRQGEGSIGSFFLIKVDRKDERSNTYMRGKDVVIGRQRCDQPEREKKRVDFLELETVAASSLVVEFLTFLFTI